MKFGLAKAEITPKSRVKMACTGNFSDNFTSIHDDIYVRCLVMDDGKTKILLMSFDLLFHSRDLNVIVAEYAYEKYGIEPSGVIVSYTHAHTAPAVKGYNPGHHDDEYERLLVEKAKACMDKAMTSLFEGFLEYGSFDTGLNVSRRKIEKSVCKSLPAPEKERDTEMFLLCVRDMEENIRGIFVNYACHPVFYPAMTEISGEFPGRVCRLIENEHYGCIAMYTQSAGGDVRPVATMQKNDDGTAVWRRNLGFSDVDNFAQSMHGEITAFISSGRMKRADLCIKADEFEIALKIDKAPKENFTKLYNELKKYPHNPTFVNCERIVNGLYDSMPEELILHCNTIRLNEDLYIAAMGGEPCFNVKKTVKAAFGNKAVCFIGYTDSCAYIVDDEILSEGGYEPESYPEYGLAGRFKSGLNDLYYNRYSDSFDRINKRENKGLN